MKYEVIQADNIGDLEKKVQKFLDADWKPQGGVSISITGFGNIRKGKFEDAILSDGRIYCQAVIEDESVKSVTC